MKYILSGILLIWAAVAYANDGAYYASGNQLIPIAETDISVQKEVLHIRKIKNELIEVSVYYEFYNPGSAKQITVGFEAFSPEGDVDGAPVNGQHPYMRNFKVIMNNVPLKCSTALVADTLYQQNGKIKTIDWKTFEGNKTGNTVDFFYVYHFKANFKKGLNIIKHTYQYDASGSVDFDYDFDYILTAANRWANRQIDDFTLVLDMGVFESFHIAKSFFDRAADWQINGIGKVTDDQGRARNYEQGPVASCHIRQGTITFHQKNFRPRGELFVYSWRFLPGSDHFDYNNSSLPFSIYQQTTIPEPSAAAPINRKILRNLPFARRGYIFKDKELQDYFTHMTDWYMPDPGYQAEIQKLEEAEKKWFNKWKE
ncbi:MAG: YARHG domain-containing protein [Sphingobacteriales bacterium]|nr:MAG: YARHG domain-containing protein [Sphingobacteriales bacterium]